MFELEYVRTDRNGTKYYHDWNCPRCGGAGECDKWYRTGRTCYACGGSGRRATPKLEKVYTPEHYAKLQERRLAREALKPRPSEEELLEKAKATERVILRDNGLTEDGIGYVYGGKTYPIKDQIKSAGGKWIYGVWIAPIKIDVPNSVSVKKINIYDYRTEGNSFDWFLATAL